MPCGGRLHVGEEGIESSSDEQWALLNGQSGQPHAAYSHAQVRRATGTLWAADSLLPDKPNRSAIFASPAFLLVSMYPNDDSRCNNCRRSSIRRGVLCRNLNYER